MKLRIYSLYRIWMMILWLVMVQDVLVQGKLRQVKPGCRYEGRRYQEGTTVITPEPCLRCRCIEGALRCRLRVCPRLPNPTPSGCHVRPPVDNVCCAELVCNKSNETVALSARNNFHPTEDNTTNSTRIRMEGCLYEGVKYGPGSAMMGSQRCEYCYCISGARRCIRPKCLLPLPGCTPLYAPHSCCPVSYNCTRLRQSSTIPPITGNGCRLANHIYQEGEMVRDFTQKTACVNCFCVMGAIRCVPLACAPPLHGCTPIVRDGQCCPSTYNCSGSIEVEAAQNYASFAFISKDYAKFRKETHFFPAMEHHTTTKTTTTITTKINTSLPTTTRTPMSTLISIEGRGHRVVEEQKLHTSLKHEAYSPFTIDPTSTISNFETEIINNEILQDGTDNTRSTPDIITTTNSIFTEETTITTPGEYSKDLTSTDSSTTLDSTEEITTPINDFTTSFNEDTTLLPSKKDLKRCNNNNNNNNTGIGSNLTRNNDRNLISIVENNDEKKNTSMDSEVLVKDPAARTNSSSTILMPDNILVMNVTVKTNVSVGHIQGVTINPIRSIPPDIEAILNITHREKPDEYDYDYSDPTLPPSLPNVRIIPFVAADALVQTKEAPSSTSDTGYSRESAVVVLPDLLPTEKSNFYDMATQENRFSPPIETEGGFVPKEPPYFESSYHSTDLNLEIGIGVTVEPAVLPNPHRKNDDLLSNNCIFKNHEYHHGDILPKQGICMMCMCYYSEIVCSPQKCSPLKIGCKTINTEESCCGKIICVDEEESPTVVLDRADPQSIIVSPDPFRDVIKTEPAPDLPSLIEDMRPYLLEHGITTSRSSTSSPTQPISTSPLDRHVVINNPSIFDYTQEIDEKPNLQLEDFEEPLESNVMFYSDEKLQQPNVPITSKLNTSYLKDQRGSSTSTTTRIPMLILNETKTNHSDLVNTIELNTTRTNENKDNSPEEESIFSLHSVFDLLFSAETSTSKTTIVTIKDIINVTDVDVTTPATLVTTIGQDFNKTTTTQRSHLEKSTSTKISDNEISQSTGPLKLAGCNIYGRMYRVGRIITELSSSCLECWCTEIGVQCKQLEC